MTRGRLILFGKILIALAILALLSRYVNLTDISARMRGAALGYVLAALAALGLQVVCASLRWIQILGLSGCKVKIWRSIGCFAAGSLVNAALPGGVVGDAMRVWVTVRDGAGLGETTYSVILDRIFALLGLGLLAAMATLYAFAVGARTDALLATASLTIGAASVAALIALAAIAPLMERFVAKAPRLFVYVKNLSAMAGAMRNPGRGLPIMAITLVANVLLVVCVTLLAWGLQIRLDPIDALIGVPLALQIAAVPVTPGGWGLREGAMAVVLARFGVDSSAAIAISVMFGLFAILANLPAATIWFAWMQLGGGRADGGEEASEGRPETLAPAKSAPGGP
jgi:glycosyltransferase 2 family protein